MLNSDRQNARAESDRATVDAIVATMSSGVELYKEVFSNDSLRKWILDMVFNATYNPHITEQLAIDSAYGMKLVAQDIIAKKEGLYDR